MGGLVIKKISYSGDNYFYESPELNDGLNVVYGDNGSGKSTFTYFLEYGLGGKVMPFEADQEKDKYSLIIKDTNNYVLLDLLINAESYLIKRYLGSNEIRVSENGDVSVFQVNRKGATSVFSDWLLGKLGIPLFEMNLGSINWRFSFNDLFRLLYHDQNTDSRRIYKAPSADNFVSDSIAIRKAIFEILLGVSSAEFFKKQDQLKAALKEKEIAKYQLDDFLTKFGTHVKGIDELNENEKELEAEINELTGERSKYLNANTNVPAKMGLISRIQGDLVATELSLAENRLKYNNYRIELDKILQLFNDCRNEISQLNKIIFTHEKLDLFKMEICPFCTTEKPDIAEGYCICGAKFKEDDYEKFVYSSKEYQAILKHKEKSISAIEAAKSSYEDSISNIEGEIAFQEKGAISLRNELEMVISESEFKGNSALIEDYNKRIIVLKDLLFSVKKEIELSKSKVILETIFNTKNKAYEKNLKEFITIKRRYEENNKSTINKFNQIYSDLLLHSSIKCSHAEIDDDYMPVIDFGEYQKASAIVPIRLMYYLTILSMALKYPLVKHPRFLIIDTPDNFGIDRDSLKNDILLINKAVELSKENPDESVKEYQIILTIGYERLPEEFEVFVIEKFNTKDDQFILKAKNKQEDSDKGKVLN